MGTCDIEEKNNIMGNAPQQNNNKSNYNYNIEDKLSTTVGNINSEKNIVKDTLNPPENKETSNESIIPKPQQNETIKIESQIQQDPNKNGNKTLQDNQSQTTNNIIQQTPMIKENKNSQIQENPTIIIVGSQTQEKVPTKKEIVNSQVQQNSTTAIIGSQTQQDPMKKGNINSQVQQNSTTAIIGSQVQQDPTKKSYINSQVQHNSTTAIIGRQILQDPTKKSYLNSQVQQNPTTSIIGTQIQQNLIGINNLGTQTQIAQNLNYQIQQNQKLMNYLNNQIQQNKNLAIENQNYKNQIGMLSKIINEKNMQMQNYEQIKNFQFGQLQYEAKSNKIIYIQTINQLQIHYEQKKNKLYEQEEKLRQYEQKIKELKEIINESKIPITIGLENIGATCYMNATLQSLSNTPDLKNFFLNKYQYNQNDINKKMSNEFFIVIKHLWDKKKNKQSYAPHSFKNVLSHENPLFAGIQANDSKDLINFLLERFHKELNESNFQQNNNYLITQTDQLDEDKMLKLFLNEFNNKYHSIISNLFYGIMETKSQCLGCQKIKYNFQVYSFLEFPLEQVNKYCLSKGVRKNKNPSNSKNPDVDLYECFNYYGNIELMTGDNQMYCNICQRNCDAFYGTSLYSLPNYLIINLNRGKGAVYECKVIYPEKLNLLNFVTYQNEKGKTYFELYAVISHIGPSSMSGHFVAYCKHHLDNKWYKYNDSIVTPCTKKHEYNEGMPYILFYKAY